jgi:purine-binding chemotaxis protein CheW
MESLNRPAAAEAPLDPLPDLEALLAPEPVDAPPLEEPGLDLPIWEAELIETPELPCSPAELPEPELVRGEDSGTAAGPQLRYLVITVAGLDCAVALPHVLEIDHPRAVTPLPNVPRWLQGISQVRGDILSVVDLPGLLRLERGGPVRSSRLLVVRSLRDGLTLGLLVERVREIVRVPDGPLDPLAEPVPEGLARYLEGAIRTAQRPLPVLDLERLLQGPELRQFEPL